MNPEQERCLIVAEFNAANLAGYLNNAAGDGDLLLQAQCGPYGQVASLLMDAQADCWRQEWAGLVIWTNAETVSPTYRQALEYQVVDAEAALAEVEAFAGQIRQAVSRASCVLVPTWTRPTSHRGLGMLDWHKGVGAGNLLARMNLRLSECLSDLPQVFVLDAGRWVAAAGKFAFNPKLWYMGKIPFGHEVFKAAAADIRAALAATRGQSRKLVVLDLDETLWGGIVGDAGWENLRLGGHDPIGEAYVDFQRELKALTARGIVLAIVSKNDEAVALEAIRRHPEMVLKESDFAGWRINWTDKARNVAELVADLNLGLQSTVFIDDNPAERARVKEQLPDVLVPDWPEDRMLYRQSLLQLTCFDTPMVGSEDQQRTAMYVAERQRKKAQVDVGSLQDWLKSLEMKVVIEPLLEHNLPRTAQLLNKTNQMNLTTRRMTEAELMAWATEDDHALWAVRVADRFGEAGLTGIVSFCLDGDTLQIVDFVLSCRVFGRQVEHLMLALAVHEARRAGCRTVLAEFFATAKNKPCHEFFEKSGMERIDETPQYRWQVNQDYPWPEHVQVEGLVVEGSDCQ